MDKLFLFHTAKCMKSTTTFDSGTELEVTLCIAKENGTIFLGTSGDQDELTIHRG